MHTAPNPAGRGRGGVVSGAKNTLHTLLVYHNFPKGGPSELIRDRKGLGVASMYVPFLVCRCLGKKSRGRRKVVNLCCQGYSCQLQLYTEVL